MLSSPLAAAAVVLPPLPLPLAPPLPPVALLLRMASLSDEARGLLLGVNLVGWG